MAQYRIGFLCCDRRKLEDGPVDANGFGIASRSTWRLVLERACLLTPLGSCIFCCRINTDTKTTILAGVPSSRLRSPRDPVFEIDIMDHVGDLIYFLSMSTAEDGLLIGT